ncbi:hypothetical protein F5878DRAFT_436469 [Lentinula raphanica]|uniref:Uncharacterized protein n=1 Tax=Lentinula raphanica TaxID=153919 RepID=A0AA38UN74_9AGAR|nr:hypothetical protein F5878DRAFT_436469 [Lentinula raphanica]
MPEIILGQVIQRIGVLPLFLVARSLVHSHSSPLDLPPTPALTTRCSSIESTRIPCTNSFESFTSVGGAREMFAQLLAWIIQDGSLGLDDRMMQSVMI